MTPQELKALPQFGSYAAIARACGVTREAPRGWKKIPARCCPAIEAITGIPCEQLRDDIDFIREGGVVVKYCVRIKKKDD